MSFDEDAVGSLQTGSAVTRSAPRLSLNISSSAEDDCERGGNTLPTHSRIGRASPVLQRVWSSFPYGEIPLIGHTDIISNDDVSFNLHAYLDHTHYDQDIPSYHWESCTLRYRNSWQGKSSCSLKWVDQSWQYSVLYRHPGFRRCNRVRVQWTQLEFVARSLQQVKLEQVKNMWFSSSNLL